MTHEIIALATELKERSLHLPRNAVEVFGGGRF